MRSERPPVAARSERRPDDRRRTGAGRRLVSAVSRPVDRRTRVRAGRRPLRQRRRRRAVGRHRRRAVREPEPGSTQRGRGAAQPGPAIAGRSGDPRRHGDPRRSRERPAARARDVDDRGRAEHRRQRGPELRGDVGLPGSVTDDRPCAPADEPGARQAAPPDLRAPGGSRGDEHQLRLQRRPRGASAPRRSQPLQRHPDRAQLQHRAVVRRPRIDIQTAGSRVSSSTTSCRSATAWLRRVRARSAG